MDERLLFFISLYHYAYISELTIIYPVRTYTFVCMHKQEGNKVDHATDEGIRPSTNAASLVSTMMSFSKEKFVTALK